MNRIKTLSIILICGPQNVGKTSVARNFASALGWAAIEVDKIRHFIPDSQKRHANDFQRELTHGQALCLIKGYLEHDIAVIIDDQSYDLEFHNRRMNEYRSLANACSIALISNRSILTGSRNKYAEGDSNLSRIDDILTAYHECIAANAYDEVVQTDELSLEQTVTLLGKRLHSLSSKYGLQTGGVS